MRTLKLLIGIVIATMIGIAILGFVYQTAQERSDHVAYPAPGKFYNVDGISMHLDCRGLGTPTVLLEAGLTSGSFSWTLIHDAIAAKTRVCAYDRPGMDWSDPINRVADAKEVSDRLYRLVKEAGLDEPKILVGMSAGGIYVREFYKNHPDGIVGMVFIDSSHEQQKDRLPSLEGSAAYKAMITACRLLQPIGIVRLFGLLDQFVDQFNLDEGTRSALLANMNQSHTCSSMYWEMESFAGEVRDKTSPASLGDIPLVVLSQGEEPKANENYGITLEQAIAQRDAWNILQQELSDLSSNGRRFIAKKSGHIIQLNQPEIVIEKVGELVVQLQNANQAN